MTTITTEVMDKDTKRDRQGRQITTAERRAELVAGYRASGLTMEQFARREGIKQATLAKWVYLRDKVNVAERASLTARNGDVSDAISDRGGS